MTGFHLHAIIRTVTLTAHRSNSAYVMGGTRKCAGYLQVQVEADEAWPPSFSSARESLPHDGPHPLRLTVNDLNLTLIGGPTVLIETGGLRLLTDPTFDPAGRDYASGPVVLHKTTDPAGAVATLGRIDAVLLSHEQHSDNLDEAGRALLSTVPVVFTTPQSAASIGDAPAGDAATRVDARGLDPWQTAYLTAPGGRRLSVTATPARHGPDGAEAFSGDVTGFVLQWEGDTEGAVYVSGDTVWYGGVAEVARRFAVAACVVHLGAARVDAVGPDDLTMDAAGAVNVARAFAEAVLVPAHYDGWTHFRESRADVSRVFAEAGLSDRLLWLVHGVATPVR